MKNKNKINNLNNLKINNKSKTHNSNKNQTNKQHNLLILLKNNKYYSFQNKIMII